MDDVTVTNYQNVEMDQRGHLHKDEDRQVDCLVYSINNVSNLSLGPGVFSCAWCDAYPRFDLVNGTLVATTQCPLPQGKTVVFDLEVPSGRIVVDDDLRGWFDPVLPARVPSLNSVAGEIAISEGYAAAGCAYGMVGNSCPSLIRTGPGRYVIASDDYDEPQITGEELASICTDLWAYMIADFDVWVSRGGDPETLHRSATIADIEPGTYRFTHHSGEAGFDKWARPAVWADIEKIA